MYNIGQKGRGKSCTFTMQREKETERESNKADASLLVECYLIVSTLLLIAYMYAWVIRVE